MSIAELKGIQDVFDIQSHTHFYTAPIIDTIPYY